MKFPKAFSAAAAALFLCAGAHAAKAAKTPKPKLRPGEAIMNTCPRKKLSDETQEPAPAQTDKMSKNYFRKKYEAHASTNWRCHDPKIFQDDDGTFYVYSTGWDEGVIVRSSTDLITWTKYGNSAFWDPKDVSLKYGHMHWDDDFLRWTGFDTNDGSSYRTVKFTPSDKPQSWAPTVVKKNGRYYMFHGIITDSLTSYENIRPAACISLSIADSPLGPFIPAAAYDSGTYKNSSLVRYAWSNSEDAGNSAVGYSGCRNKGGNWEIGFGTIDPEFVIDMATGNLMEYDIGGTKCCAMTYGSWKGGIVLIYVDAETFKPVNQTTGEIMDAPLDSLPDNSGVLIAGGSGAAYEGAQLIYHSGTGYYYIFVSMGDLNIEYRVGVGRSRDITGPYLDPSGKDMKFPDGGVALGYHGYGGKIIGAHKIGSDYGFKAPGGQSVIRASDGRILFACHARTDWLDPGFFCLQVRQMFFNSDGWPLLNMNEYFGEDAAPAAPALSELAGTYDVVLTERRGVGAAADGIATPSKKMTVDASGNVTGAYTGRLSFAGNELVLDLGTAGVFKGIAMKAVDHARKGAGGEEERTTVTFTALNSGDGATAKKQSTKGEYLFGNKAD